jgi:leucyl aminopeptidase
MRFNEAAPPLSLTVQPPSDLDVDVLVVASADKQVMPTVTGLDNAAGGRLEQAARAGEFSGKAFATFVTPAASADWRPARVMLVGLGPLAGCDVNQIRKWAAAAASAAREKRLTRAAFVLPGVLSGPEEAQAVAEGVTLAAFSAGIYKSDSEAIPPALEPRIVAPPVSGPLALDDLERAVSKGYILGSCTNVARALVNEPANRMTPRIFAEAAEQVAAAVGLKVDVLDEDRIAGLNMGLLLGVARGSVEPPRVIVLRYEPAKRADGPVLGLVGKGITFDTGGISIKTAEGMHRMKTDMAGGAAVLGAMKAIAALKPDIAVIGVIPLAENMPDGKAFRPGDVIRGASGHTVEVLDTDAEGRLILGDALWYAAYLGATHLVDIATLTGACVVALGRTTSGIFGAPPFWADTLQAVTRRTGDRAWVMPVFDDYKEQLRSEIADLANVGGRAGGAITAALFVKEFAAGLPWAHLDIAGTAWADDTQPYQPKGPTGVGVRTLAELALDAHTWAAQPRP